MARIPRGKELVDIAAGIVLINLPGHTRGHAAVAVDTGKRWILHVGDSFYHHSQIDGSGKPPISLTGMERLIAHDWGKVQANHRRLQELWDKAEPDLLFGQCPRPHAATSRADHYSMFWPTLRADGVGGAHSMGH